MNPQKKRNDFLIKTSGVEGSDGAKIAFFLLHPLDLQHLFCLGGDPETVVDPVADNPGDFPAGTQNPGVLFVIYGEFVVGKIVAELFLVISAKRIEKVTMLPFSKSQGECDLVKIKIGDPW